MKLNEKLIKLRKEKGLSQEEFGNEINVSRQAVSKWENGETKPDIDKIQEIVKKFDVSYNYLLDDELETKEEIKEENIKMQEEENKNPKKKKKIVLKIILIIFLIYLLICIYKFIAFYKFYSTANSFSEENYWLNEYISYSGLNPASNSNTIFDIKKVGNKIISQIVNFEEFEDMLTDENGRVISNSISFTDADKKESYTLSYNKDEGTYTYYDDTQYLTDEEKEAVFDLSENYIKEFTLELIPSGFKEIFLASINPMYYYVSISNREIKTYSISEETKEKITLNNDYLVESHYMKSEYNSIITVSYSYDYVQDHFTEIQDPLEQYSDKIV
jgi:transcriptional regulator with XRE-family HTH domain